MEILLFDLKIPRNNFVLGKISYAIRKRELPPGADETYFKVEGPKNQGYERFKERPPWLAARKILEIGYLRYGQKQYLKWILTEGKSEEIFSSFLSSKFRLL